VAHSGRPERRNGANEIPVKKNLKKVLKPVKSWLTGDAYAQIGIGNQLLGRMASQQVRAMPVLQSLRDAEFKVSSQWGEDGIIDWLVERAQIPPRLQTFVEFGVETYREANTRFLLQNRNWRGLILDGDPAMVEAVRKDLFWGYDLTARAAFITRENINDLIREGGFSGEIGLLSIDLDGNDYWVWEAMEAVQPVIVVCEYNAVFGDVYPISTPYDPQFNRTRAHYSNLYFGASIAALRRLAERKGYRFAGTTSAANDSFFVREDYAQRFLEGSLRQIEALPSLVRDSRDRSGQLNFIGGMERLKHLADLPVVNVATQESVRLGDLDPIYSGEWLDFMLHGAPAGVAREEDNRGNV
jgi:hypothetical protein